jgi:hypothetical protein
MSYYYVYYSYEEWGRGYIGKRECKCLPQDDIKYFGSFRDKTFRPTQKVILETYNNREEALDAEISLHNFFQVHTNPHFANKAKQTSKKFAYDFTGGKHKPETIEKMKQFVPSESHRAAIAKANKERVHTPEMRERNRQAQLKLKRKHPPEFIAKLRERMLTNNPFKGRHHTEENKQLLRDRKLGKPSPIKGVPKPAGFSEKISRIVSGKRWFVNKDGETRQCHEHPGEGWIPGRKWPTE